MAWSILQPMPAYLTVFLALLLGACSAQPTTPTKMETVGRVESRPDAALTKILLADMTEAHQAAPSGVPLSYDWQAGPRLNLANQPGTFRAYTGWGQLYLAGGSKPVENVRVEIQALNGYVLDKTNGDWNLLQSGTDLTGAFYAEDFAKDKNVPADIRPTSAGISVAMTTGFNFHFWPTGPRKAINPEQIGGLISLVWARLVQDDPNGPDNRDHARYLMGVGGDYWLDKTAAWDNFKTNNDVGIGRFRLLTHEWQRIPMHTLTPEQLTQALPVVPSP